MSCICGKELNPERALDIPTCDNEDCISKYLESLVQYCTICNKPTKFVDQIPTCTDEKCIEFYIESHLESELKKIDEPNLNLTPKETTTSSNGICICYTAYDPTAIKLDLPLCGRYDCTIKYIRTHNVKLNVPAIDLIKLLKPDISNDEILALYTRVPLESGEKCKYYTEYKVTNLEPRTDTTYLFHGSPLKNWYSIILNGLKNYSNTDKMKNGAVYGAGIYLSSDLNISYTYSTPDPVGASVSYGIQSEDFQSIYLVGVYEIKHEEHYKKSPGVYVVPNGNLIKLAYLIIVNDNKDLSTIGNLLKEHYRTNRHHMIRSSEYFTKVGINRIEREMKSLIDESSEYIIESPANIKNNPYSWTILHKSTNQKFTIEFPKKYPLEPPRIRVHDHYQNYSPITSDGYIWVDMYKRYDVHTHIRELFEVAQKSLKKCTIPCKVPFDELLRTARLISYSTK